MTDVLLFVLGLAGQWSLGVAVALCVLGPNLLAKPVRGLGTLVARAELIGLGFVLGISANSVLLFVWSLAGGTLGRGSSLTLAITGIVLGLIAWLVQRRSNAVAHDTPEVTEGKAFTRCAAGLLVLLLLFAMTQALLTPQKFWDERAYYGLKAIVLFEDGTVHSPDLKEPDFVQGHPRYPLLISLAEQHLYALLGRIDDRLVKVIFPILYFGLVLTFAGVLMRHLDPGRAWLAALLLATIPVLMPDDYGVICGQADAPVACLAGVALLYLWDALSTQAATPDGDSTWLRSLTIGTLMLSFTAFTKDEGISFALIHSSCFLFLLLPGCLKSSPKKALVAVLTLIVVPAIILGPWFVHRRELPMTGEMNYFGRLSPAALWNGLSTLNWSVPHMAQRMFAEANQWGLQWWLIGLAIVLFPRRAFRSPELFLLLTLLGDIAALLLVGMIAPVALEEHITGSSHRYLMQLAPGGLLLTVSLLWTHRPSAGGR